MESGREESGEEREEEEIEERRRRAEGGEEAEARYPEDEQEFEAAGDRGRRRGSFRRRTPSGGFGFSRQRASGLAWRLAGSAPRGQRRGPKPSSRRSARPDSPPRTGGARSRARRARTAARRGHGSSRQFVANACMRCICMHSLELYAFVANACMRCKCLLSLEMHACVANVCVR